jgi:hypothetical protein
MSGFISGADRSQETMFPAQLEDYVAEDNPVRVIDFFVDQADLRELGQHQRSRFWPLPRRDNLRREGRLPILSPGVIRWTGIFTSMYADCLDSQSTPSYENIFASFYHGRGKRRLPRRS